MTVKHATPGPWTASYGWSSDGRTEPDPEHPDWCEITGGSFVDGTHMSLSGHIGMANARLAASAPALLKALRELLEFSEYDPTDLPAHEYEACKADAQSRARAAISAAEPE